MKPYVKVKIFEYLFNRTSFDKRNLTEIRLTSFYSISAFSRDTSNVAAAHIGPQLLDLSD